MPTSPAKGPIRDTGRQDPEGDSLEGIFRFWVDSDLKVQVLVFFRDNPGVMETVPGLARRLGADETRMADIVADHVRIGILRAWPAGKDTIILYDRREQESLSARLKDLVEARIREEADQ